MSFALGLGGIHVQSGLGQAFQASIDVIGLEDEFDTGCVEAILYSSDGNFIVRPQVSIRRGGRAPSLLLSTRRLVHEPGVLVSLNIGCPAPIQRQYQVLLDPPDLYPQAKSNSTKASGAHGIDLGTVGRQSQISPTEEVRAAGNLAPTRQRSDRAAAESPAARRSNRPSTLAKSRSIRPAQRDVLRLSGDDFPAMFRLKMANSLSVPGNGTQPQRQEELRAAQQRFAAIVSGEEMPRNAAAQTAEPVASTPAVTQPTRPAIEAAPSSPGSPTQEDSREKPASSAERGAPAIEKQGGNTQESAMLIRQEKADTVSSAWLSTLTALLILCMGTIAWLVWQMRIMHGRQRQPWWEKTPPKAADQASVAPMEKEAEIAGDDHDLDVFAVEPLRSVPRETPARPDAGAESTQLKELPAKNLAAGLPNLENTISQLMASFSMKSTALDVEELSDVTQEAEFWISLNDPKRAIEILEPQCSVERPDTPVSWLYLLDLYHEVDERIKYDALRARFMEVFNAYIPEFDAASVSPARSLEDFPHLVKRICQTWPGTDTMRFLEGLLIDDRCGARVGFELSAYRDILFLISILQERALQLKLEEVPDKSL